MRAIQDDVGVGEDVFQATGPAGFGETARIDTQVLECQRGHDRVFDLMLTGKTGMNRRIVEFQGESAIEQGHVVDGGGVAVRNGDMQVGGSTFDDGKCRGVLRGDDGGNAGLDRKSTRLNSSH